MDAVDPLSRAGYALLLVAVPLVVCNALRASESMTYGDVPLAIAAGLLFVHWLQNGHPTGVTPVGLLVGTALLLATGILAIVPSENTASLVPTLRFAVTLGAMPLMLMLGASTPPRIQLLVDAWLVAVVVNSIVAVLDVLGITSIGLALTSIDFVRFTDRAPGLTSHPNHLGLIAAMALPVAVARLGTGGRRGLTALGVVPIILAGVAASGSRGALLAGVAGVIIFFAFGVATRRSRSTLMLFGGPVAAFVILASALGNGALTGSVAVSRLAGDAGTQESNNARLLTLRESVSEAAAHPLVGEGFAVVRTAHNIYIQLLQAGGLLALAGFVAFAASIMRRARWLAQQPHASPPWLPALAAGCGASVSVWLLFGMFGNAVYDRYLYVPVGLVLALAIVHQRSRLARGTSDASQGVAPSSPDAAPAHRPRPTGGAPTRPRPV